MTTPIIGGRSSISPGCNAALFLLDDQFSCFGYESGFPPPGFDHGRVYLPRTAVLAAGPSLGPAVSFPRRLRNTMYQAQHTVSGKFRTKSMTLPDIHLEVAIDLRAPEKQGHWTIRGASFIAVHVPCDRPTPTVTDYADLLVERAGALGIVVGDTLQTAATAFFVKPDPLLRVNCLTLVKAVAEALAAFGARVGATIGQADGFGENNTPEVLSQASRSVDHLLLLVESYIEMSAEGRQRK